MTLISGINRSARMAVVYLLLAYFSYSYDDYVDFFAVLRVVMVDSVFDFVSIVGSVVVDFKVNLNLDDFLKVFHEPRDEGVVGYAVVADYVTIMLHLLIVFAILVHSNR